MEIEIIYSSKNFVVLKDKEYKCYSYRKLIATYDKKLVVNNANIETQKNKCHLKQFQEILTNLKNGVDIEYVL